MIKRILSSIKNGTFFDKVKNKFFLMYISLYRKIKEPRIKINNKKVLFLTFQGNYNCNPKAIADEFIKRKLDYELIWAVRKENLADTSEYPKELKLVDRASLEFYKEAASAKIIIDNANNFEYLKLNKKEGQILLQPWHGSMGFKKIETNKNSNWMKKASFMDSITDYCIVNSDFEIDVFRSTFWPTTELLKYGHPRNDVLFNKNNEFNIYSAKVRKKYNISKDTKILLYAPTFRDNCSFESYNLDYKKLNDALVKKFGGKWCILVRFHFKLKHAQIPKKYINKVINATDYPDMQELMCASDIGITDYSSWMCDYVLTYRPGFLFATDINDYLDERGFYYPLESTPFKLATNNDEMINNILNFDLKEYNKEVKKFLKDRGCFEEGNASKKTVDKIIELSRN
jgi:CDP-glycerol glycerophosphotransferase